MKMKIVEKDPRVPFVLDPDRAETINCQVNEVISAMAENLDFEAAAETLGHEIDAKILEINAKMATTDKKATPEQEAERLERFASDKEFWESRRRTAAQLADEKSANLKKQASDVLRGFHEKKMAGRLAQWKTTCRFDGCEKQPRFANSSATSGHKASHSNHVFCAGHAGVKSMISKADLRRLKSNTNLRVVAQ